MSNIFSTDNIFLKESHTKRRKILKPQIKPKGHTLMEFPNITK